MQQGKIQQIFSSHVKLPAAYFSKHASLPPCPIKAWNNSWRGHDFPRVACILDFVEWTKKHGLCTGKRLAITSDDPENEFLTYEDTFLLQFPPWDLHNLVLENQFNMFVFNQTLEHLHTPQLAMNNIARSLVPGGHMFTSVPTLNIPHMTPMHFGGFTPMGLAALCVNAGLEIVEMGQWGNKAYLHELFDRHAWPDVDVLRSNIQNEERNVCQCWVLARKPVKTQHP